MKTSTVFVVLLLSISFCSAQDQTFKLWATGQVDFLSLYQPSAQYRTNVQKYTIEGWYNASTWRLSSEQAYTFPLSDCSSYSRRSYSYLSGTTITLSKLDTVIYQNGKVKEVQSYYIDSGVKTLDYRNLYIYSNNRPEPDTIVGMYNYDTIYTAYAYDSRNRVIKMCDFENTISNETARIEFNWDNNDNLLKIAFYNPNTTTGVWELNGEDVFIYSNNKITQFAQWYKKNATEIDSIRSDLNYKEGTTRVSSMTNRNNNSGTLKIATYDTLVSFNIKNYPLRVDHFARYSQTDTFLTLSTRNNYTYYPNDTLVKEAITLKRSDPPILTFVNYLRESYEYCGITNNINDLSKESLTFTLFPNPTSDLLTVNISSDNVFDLSIHIANATGQVIKKETKNAFSLADLPAGLYFLTVDAGNKRGVQRFVIVK